MFYLGGILGLVTLVWILDGLRIRSRVQKIAVLKPAADPIHPDHVILTRKGYAVDAGTQRAASAHASSEGLEVLVLIAGDAPLHETAFVLQNLDPITFRTSRIARGRAAGEAVLIHKDVLRRLDPHSVQLPDTAESFARFTSELKKFAPTSTDLAVAPALHSARQSLTMDADLLRYFYMGAGAPMLLVQIALIVSGLIYRPVLGVIALVAFSLQPFITFAGTAIRPKELKAYVPFKIVFDLQTALKSLLQDKAKRQAPVESLRPVYKQLLAQGTEPFFEERRDDCPLCASRRLALAVASRDYLQFKPGEFRLERCEDCAHTFQNPRLSIAGLEFYYRDFYDGLGADQLEAMFSHEQDPYLARANMLKGTGPDPKRWLDVGSGHAHFCSVARDVWPAVKFDALDLNEGVELAERRGWTDRSYRGLFPELAEAIANEQDYDVVSMSHYLEHTRDPKAEIEAAAKLLPKGGRLLIELPDPDSRLARWFGAYWLPWLQPQHQHFLSTANLEKLLKAHNFETRIWHRGEAHQTSDFVLATGLFFNKLAGPVDQPWLKRTSFLQRTRNALVYAAALPFLAVTRTLDLILAPLLRRPGWSNTYRVLAEKVA